MTDVWILIPIFAIFVAGIAIFLKYKKDMLLIAKGREPLREKDEKEGDLTAGLILIAIAIGLYIGFYYGIDGFQAYMIAPLVCFFVGIALLLSYWAKTKKQKIVVKRKRVIKKKAKKKR